MRTPKIRIDIDLDEFNDEQIKNYASNELGMFEDLEEVDTCLLLEELSSRGLQGLEIYDYNILLSSALEKIMANIDIVDVEDFKNTIRKCNL